MNSSPSPARAGNYAPPLLALLVLWGMIGAILVASLGLNGGHLSYALDDPYIHMAMARNIAAHGVWGITPYGFASTSSSPLWLAVLAGLYAIFGVSEVLPFILCLLSATALVLITDALLRRFIPSAAGRFTALLALILFLPLAPLTFFGLEHITHALLAIAFMHASARYLAEPEEGSPGRWRMWLLILAPLLTAVRYEGALMIGVVALLLALRRRIGLAVVVSLMGALPLVIYGIASRAAGWFFLPNSILLKGNIPDAGLLAGAVRFVMDGAYAQIVHEPAIIVALLALGLALVLELRRERFGWRCQPVLLVIAALTILLHIQFAGIGGFHRYEAYLMGLMVAALAPSLVRMAPAMHAALRGRRDLLLAGIAVGGIALLPFIHRALKATVTPRATANIHQQQYQMGRFVARYYHDRPVAVNDIGAVSFIGGARTLDIYGLGSLEPVLLKRAGRYNALTLDSLCRGKGAKVAMLYESWLLRDAGAVPATWAPVGRWTIGNNIVCGDTTVTFYAIDPAERAPLVEHLREFSRELPEGVRVED